MIILSTQRGQKTLTMAFKVKLGFIFLKFRDLVHNADFYITLLLMPTLCLGCSIKNENVLLSRYGSVLIYLSVLYPSLWHWHWDMDCILICPSNSPNWCVKIGLHTWHKCWKAGNLEGIHLQAWTNIIQVRMLMRGIKRYGDPQIYYWVTMITAKGHYLCSRKNRIIWNFRTSYS